MKKIKNLKEMLYQFYYVDKKSTVQIGKIFGCSHNWVGKLMKQHNFQVRTPLEDCFLFHKIGDKWCNDKEANDKCSDCGKELNSYRKKKVRCQECWKKFRKNNIKKYYCIDCGKPLSKGAKFKKSIRCRKCYGLTIRGKNHCRWKGGEVKLSNRIRGTWKYNEYRKKVLMRDNYTCQISGKKDKLIIHHKIPIRSIIRLYKLRTYKQILNCKLLWDINWAVTLNSEIHNKLGAI